MSSPGGATKDLTDAASGVAAASANEVAELIGAARAASITASSAYPPRAVREMRHRHDPVPGRQAGDPGTHAVDGPGHVIAQDARHPQPGPAAIRPVTRVDRVDSSRMHDDPHLAGPGDRISSLARLQLLRAAELADEHDFHSRVPPVASQPRRIHPWPAPQADIMTHPQKPRLTSAPRGSPWRLGRVDGLWNANTHYDTRLAACVPAAAGAQPAVTLLGQYALARGPAEQPPPVEQAILDGLAQAGVRIPPLPPGHDQDTSPRQAAASLWNGAAILRIGGG
jgi:hypothetical protein